MVREDTGLSGRVGLPSHEHAHCAKCCCLNMRYCDNHLILRLHPAFRCAGSPNCLPWSLRIELGPEILEITINQEFEDVCAVDTRRHDYKPLGHCCLKHRRPFVQEPWTRRQAESGQTCPSILRGWRNAQRNEIRACPGAATKA